MQNQKGHIVARVIALILQFVFRYARSIALALMILPLIVILAVTYLPLIKGEHIQWLSQQVLSFMHTSELHISFDTEGVVRIFAKVSLAFFLFVEFLRLCGLKMKLSFKKSLFTIVTICLTSIGIGMLRSEGGDMAGAFIALGILSLGAYAVWHILGAIPRVVSQIRPLSTEETQKMMDEYERKKKE